MKKSHLTKICEAAKVALSRSERYRLYLASGKHLP